MYNYNININNNIDMKNRKIKMNNGIINSQIGNLHLLLLEKDKNEKWESKNIIKNKATICKLNTVLKNELKVYWGIFLSKINFIFFIYFFSDIFN